MSFRVLSCQPRHTAAQAPHLCLHAGTASTQAGRPATGPAVYTRQCGSFSSSDKKCTHAAAEYTWGCSTTAAYRQVSGGQLDGPCKLLHTAASLPIRAFTRQPAPDTCARMPSPQQAPKRGDQLRAKCAARKLAEHWTWQARPGGPCCQPQCASGSHLCSIQSPLVIREDSTLRDGDRRFPKKRSKLQQWGSPLVYCTAHLALSPTACTSASLLTLPT